MKRLDIGIVIVLVALTLIARVPLAMERKLMPAGDAFNFHFIASHLAQLSYPKDERRLPVYAVFLWLGRSAGIDPLVTSVAVSLLASAGSVALIYVLGRQFKLPRPVVLPFAGLAIFDELLTLNALRPLADSTFIFLVLLSFSLLVHLLNHPAAAGRAQLLATGGVFTLTILTRYEGLLIVALLLPFMWWKIAWRQALLVTAIPVAIGLAWLPVHVYVHGSLGHSYFAFAAEEESFGVAKRIPQGVKRILTVAGWGQAWEIPAFELGEEPRDKAGARIIRSSSWWLSLLAVAGVFWLIIQAGVPAIAVLLPLAAYTVLVAWWFVYSRYMAPLSPVFYLTAAGGAGLLAHYTSRYFPWSAWLPRSVPYALAVIVSLVVVWQEAPARYKAGVGRAWDGNGRGYHLYQAVKELHRDRRPVIIGGDFPMSVAYLGNYTVAASRVNPGLAWYLHLHPDASLEDLYPLLARERIPRLLDDRERTGELAQYLRDRGILTATKRFLPVTLSTTPVEPESPVYIHELTWP